VSSSVPSSSTHTTGASPSACLQSADDDLKLERKRRQRQKQEEFLQQLKKKQLTQTKSLVDKDTGIQN
jgi:phage-related minor tail protein